jgi:ubiquinone/menaquinone biosynthesis C-methylase UbiE
MNASPVTRIDKDMENDKFWQYPKLPILWVATLAMMVIQKTGLVKIIWRTVAKNLPAVSEVAKKAKTSRALDIIYDYERKPLPELKIPSLKSWRKFIVETVMRFLFEIRHCQGARNRLKIVKWLIGKEGRRIPLEKTWKLLVIACGSSRASLEAVAERKKIGGQSTVILVDKSPRALAKAMALATSLGIADMVVAIRGDAMKIADLVKDFQPDTVEAVGLTDYLTDKDTIALINAINGLLVEGGKLITGNIAPNTEKPFVKIVFCWSMIYRTLTELRRIALASKFPQHGIEIFTEPLGMFYLLVLSK